MPCASFSCEGKCCTAHRENINKPDKLAWDQGYLVVRCSKEEKGKSYNFMKKMNRDLL
jgi:hypothetical protein